MLMFQIDNFIFSFDLKSGYHHIDIHQEHWKYLGFIWDSGSKVQYYVFSVTFWLGNSLLPFHQTYASPLVKY